jgi:methylase of polypeptide subunit release factors
MAHIEYAPPGQWEADERVADLYHRAQERTGMQIPVLDPVMERVTARRQVAAELDRNPAQELFDRHSIEYPYSCTFGDAQLVIDEDVFCPTFTKVSPLLLGAVDFKQGDRVLDAFAGSGAFGVNAALRGATEVVSIDISKKAIECVQKNVGTNEVAIEARLGTVKERVRKNETFDLIIANPPLLPGESTDELTAAVFDEGLQATLDFIEQLPRMLSTDGRCYLVTSNILERCRFSIPDLCRKVGLRASVACVEDVGYEKYTVHKIEHPPRFNLRWLLLKR